MRTVLLVSLAALLAGCVVDLPSDWEGALGIADLIQSECEGDPYEDQDERVEAARGTDTLNVSYLEAHFRCEQDVQAFGQIAGSTLEVLVQPVDMNPNQVTACDCLYEIEMTPPLSGWSGGDIDGVDEVTLSRRWDNINDPNDPVLIGSVTVE